VTGTFCAGRGAADAKSAVAKRIIPNTVGELVFFILSRMMMDYIFFAQERQRKTAHADMKKPLPGLRLFCHAKGCGSLARGA